MKKYIPLHVHSHYSLLDGLSKPQQIADRCKEIEVNACALTDHGNIAGSVQFYKQMKANGIKPILGCELYICRGKADEKVKENMKLEHFLVLAKNLEGWKNLISLVSKTNSPDFFYRKPRVNLSDLADYAKGTLIGITGHLGSTLANRIVTEDTIDNDWKSNSTKHLSQLIDIFGQENLF